MTITEFWKLKTMEWMLIYLVKLRKLKTKPAIGEATKEVELWYRTQKNPELGILGISEREGES